MMSKERDNNKERSGLAKVNEVLFIFNGSL